MDNEKKEKIKNALIIFIKACIPPFIAFLSSVLTTLISSGDITTATTVGAVMGITAGAITNT